jgi:FG-GAP-like repeat
LRSWRTTQALGVVALSALVVGASLGCKGDSGSSNTHARGAQVCADPRCMTTTTQKACPNSPCRAVTVVTTAEGLRNEIAAWEPQTRPDQFKVIEIPDGTSIDLATIADDLPLELKDRIVIESTRGARRPGALLYLDDYKAITDALREANPSLEDAVGHVFHLAGDRVSIRNLRLRGPSSSIADYGATCGLPGDDLCPPLVAIDVVDRYRVWILDNEIFNWPGEAVDIRGDEDTLECQSRTRGYRVQVFRNYIHHNQRNPLGYGVKVNDDGFAFIEGNTFDWNRHAVAGDGSALSGYYARYNYVLSGGSPYPSKYGGSTFPYYNQHFDMHGTGEGGYGGIAGDFVEIRGNTVHGEQKYGAPFFEKTRPVYRLRGYPCHVSEFRDNVLWHDDEDEAVRATDGGEGRVAIVNNQFATDTSWSLAVGDFDRDGRDDLFQATGAAWYYSSGGVTEWRLLQAGRRETIDRLRFGDFDGDGDTDVFTAVDGEWLISRGGTTSWEHLKTSPFRVGDLRFGDFDGDGRTDAFRTDGSHWYYYPGATGDRQGLADSAYTVEELRFGNFDGNNRTDVFGIENGEWAVSHDGDTGWQRLNAKLTSDLDSLVFGDFDGDGRTDIAQSRQVWQPRGGYDVEWRISWHGTTGWTTVRRFTQIPGDGQAHLYNNWIGRFDSTPGVDALRYELVRQIGPGEAASLQGVYLIRSSGVRSNYVRHSQNSMR